MRLMFIRTLFCAMVLIPTLLVAQGRRMDTTMKVGKAGFRVNCQNKSAEKNPITIYPVGFESEARDFSFELKGVLIGTEVDDLNKDGFPELLLYVAPQDSLNKSSVIAISSQENKSVAPIVFPDILDDPRLRDGYKGSDKYMLLEGILMRTYPLYEKDANGVQQPTGKMRRLMYRVAPGEQGTSKFVVARFYDFQKK
ncbi:MAG: hypothetical protein ACK4X2_00560 [Bacteroidota bacterium]|jgi:hypothetical protein